MTGWKVGYITAPVALATVIARAHQNLAFSTAPNLQRAVAVGLDQDAAYFETLASEMQLRRDILASGLREMGFSVLPCDGTYFLTADIRGVGELMTGAETDLEWSRRMTVEAGVTVIPVSAFYDGALPGAPSHLVRFAFCKKPIILEQALTRLRDRIGRG